MLRAVALIIALIAACPAFAADPWPIAAPAPLMCHPTTAAEASCGPVQLAAASCSQTCYDDQSTCHQSCDKVYRSGLPDHDKCVAACTTTYGRCSQRCGGR